MPVVVDNSEATCSRGSNVLVGLRTQFRDKRKILLCFLTYPETAYEVVKLRGGTMLYILFLVGLALHSVSSRTDWPVFRPGLECSA